MPWPEGRFNSIMQNISFYDCLIESFYTSGFNGKSFCTYKMIEMKITWLFWTVEPNDQTMYRQIRSQHKTAATGFAQIPIRTQSSQEIRKSDSPKTNAERPCDNEHIFLATRKAEKWNKNAVDLDSNLKSKL